VFPTENPRPFPNSEEGLNGVTEGMDEDVVDAVSAREKINNADGLFGIDDVDSRRHL
jgi:hypothetical protein